MIAYGTFPVLPVIGVKSSGPLLVLYVKPDLIERSSRSDCIVLPTHYSNHIGPQDALEISYL